MNTTKFDLIEKYIFECIDFSEYEKQPIDKREQLVYLLEICEREKFYNKYKSQKAKFIDWCYGLPQAFRMDYQQFKVLELCKEFNLNLPKNEYELFDFWYGILYTCIVYLIKNIK